MLESLVYLSTGSNDVGMTPHPVTVDLDGGQQPLPAKDLQQQPQPPLLRLYPAASQHQGYIILSCCVITRHLDNVITTGHIDVSLRL